MSTPISLRNLTKRFGSTTAVNGIDLDVAGGDLFFLLGPSGCGKTTLLRMIAGFTQPTDGSMVFGDRSVTNLPPNKRNCGMVFQGYALWPHMTVEQNVMFGLDVRKQPADEKRKRVAEALDIVQMSQYASRKPNELSGGQQQRVALARALVIEPTVLLLDEPLSNLDAKLRLEMRSQIRDICKKVGTTGVYVTHDQKEALSMADCVAVLKDGDVMQVGPPREIYDRPNNRFVADFLGETNFITGSIHSRNGDHVIVDTQLGRMLSATFPTNLNDNGAVTCSIRPEAIQLVHKGDSESTNNCFSAKRISQIYLGEVAQHQLGVGENVELKAFELNPKPLADFDGSVHIMFDPEDVVILRD